ncbi:hypothetical protein AB0M54_24260 [Actinoplanes sp. NPDC051470]|uniref:hypothetical protein n=1 Tax=Actinoplanes sp. NPDC051470 TaxID=3157224 RepID=UPI00343A934D
MTELWPQALTLVGILVGGYLTYLASRRNKRSDAGQQMIDQHQEDIAALRTERAKDSERITKLERTQRVQGDYIGQLRKHIVDGNPPPPPPYPEGLIT